jgi:hypothetical protein
MKVAKLVRNVLVCTVLVWSTSGCALAARALMAAEAIDTLHDLTQDFSTDQPTAPGATTVATAVITGTHGSGLKLEARPGAVRLLALPDGARVTVLCDVTGPMVRGSGGTSSTWSRVRTAEGRVGYMSNAYLDISPGTITGC